jgi:hypothetical protein
MNVKTADTQGNVMPESSLEEGVLARVELVISIDCLTNDIVGFGCHASFEGELSQGAKDLLSVLQQTINKFAHANGISGFDCTKQVSQAS